MYMYCIHQFLKLNNSTSYYKNIFHVFEIFFPSRSVDREHSGVAGMMGAAALGSGVLAGLTLSCAMPGLVSAPALDWELPTFWPAFHPQ